MIVKENNTKLKIGDIAYFQEFWSGAIEKCKIKEISEQDGNVLAEVKSIASVDRNGEKICDTYGTSTRLLDHLFATHQEAFADADRNFANIKSKYLNEIKDLEDLLRFPMEHCFNGEEYTEYEAIAAYKQRVKELVGIDLDKERVNVLSNKEDITHTENFDAENEYNSL